MKYFLLTLLVFFAGILSRVFLGEEPYTRHRIGILCSFHFLLGYIVTSLSMRKINAHQN